MRSEVQRVERQIEQFVDRIVASDLSSISTAFENRVRSLEIEKATLTDKLADKRTMLKLAFAEPIAYARNDGFRTAEAAIPFRIFNALEQSDPIESEMVPLSGDTANQIFRDLEDWNRILAATSIKPPTP